MKQITTFIIFALTIIFNFAYSQDYRADVCTPKCSNVVAWVIGDALTASLKSYNDNYYENAYPNIDIINTNGGYSTTKKFNCHGYAWHVSDGGSNRWIGYYIGNTDEYIYWNDGGYTEVGYEPYPGKVSYALSDHSAITTYQAGWFISKWGDKVLARHRWNDCPYPSAVLKYYKLNFSITGSSLLCNNDEVYSLSQNPCLGGNYSWNTNANLSISGSSTGLSATISPESDGEGEIGFSFSSGCGTSFTLSPYEVWVGPPPTPSITSGPTTLDLYSTGVYWANKKGDWRFNIPTLLATPHSSGINTKYWEIESKGMEGTVWVRIDVSNNCGSSYALKTVYIVDGSGGGDPPARMIQIYPNPAKDFVNILVSDEVIGEIKEKKAEKYELKLYDKNQQIRFNKKSDEKLITINTSSLINGFYYLHFKYKDNTIKEQIVIQK